MKTLFLIFISFCDAEYFERLFSDLKPIDGFYLVSDTWDENEWYFEQRSCWRLGSLQNETGLFKLHPRKRFPCSGPTDVKYPPNVGRGLSSADLEVDRLYEPKQNKKIVRYFVLSRHQSAK